MSGVAGMTGSGIHLLRSLDKALDKTAGNMIEHWYDQPGQYRAGKFIVQVKLYFAPLLAQGLEIPCALQHLERTFYQPHFKASGSFPGIECGKALPDAMVVDLQRGLCLRFALG